MSAILAHLRLVEVIWINDYVQCVNIQTKTIVIKHV
jgi:hypothetical protein